jgi:C4-dicarboxylate transporter
MAIHIFWLAYLDKQKGIEEHKLKEQLRTTQVANYHEASVRVVVARMAIQVETKGHVAIKR